MKPSTRRWAKRHGGFTILEIVVAVGITTVLAGTIVATLTNVSSFWTRTSGKLSAEAQARHVLDLLTLDLQSALYRDDGNTWLAATIPANTNTTLGLWNTTGAVGGNLKPSNAAGSLQRIASGELTDGSGTGPRFGIAGTWLRFFTTKRGTNPLNPTAATTAASTSAPVAVGYQIVRRATTATQANTDRRYLFHRSEVRPAALSSTQSGTLQAGFHITAPAYEPTSGTAAAGAPAEIKLPTLNSVIAENVIDFGVRLYVRATNTNTGTVELTRIFPAADGDLSHLATLPPGLPNSEGLYSDCFPEVIDVMVRILTDDGARTLALYEAGRLTAAPGRTTQQYWWDLAMAHSQIFTRRIVLKTKPL